MSNRASWKNISDGELILNKQEPSLNVLALFFTSTLQQDSFTIKNITEQKVQGNVSELKGITQDWNSTTAQVLITYSTDNGRLLTLTLSNTLGDVQGPLTISIPNQNGPIFNDLKEVLYITVPEPGLATDAEISSKISGDLQLNSKTLELSIQGTDLTRPFSVEAKVKSPKGHSGLGLADLVSLLGHGSANPNNPHPDLDAWLPALLWPPKPAVPDPVELSDLILHFDPKQSHPLTDVYARIEFFQGHEWPIIENPKNKTKPLLAVGGLWARIDVSNPLEPQYRFPTVNVGGNIQIGKGELDITARWPDYAVHGRLKEGSVIKVLDLLNDFATVAGYHLDKSFPLANYVIDTLTFTAEPTSEQKRFTLSFDIIAADSALAKRKGGSWAIVAPGKADFAIEEISFFINYTGPSDTLTAQPASYDLSLIGVLAIGDIEFSLMGAYDSSGNWQFRGGTLPSSEISLDALLKNMEQLFGISGGTPTAAAHLRIDHISVSYNGGDGNFEFSCGCKLETSPGNELDADVTIKLTKQGETYQRDIEASLIISPLIFDLHLIMQGSNDLLVASYSHQGASLPLDIKQLLEETTHSSFVETYIPDLTIDLKDVLFVYQKGSATPENGLNKANTPSPTADNAESTEVADTNKTKKFTSKILFGLDVGTTINLSQMPLVGDKLPSDASVSIDDFQVLITSDSLSVAEVTEINTVLAAAPGEITPLPTQLKRSSSNVAATGSGTSSAALLIVQKGINLAAKIKLAGTPRTLTMTGGNGTSPTPSGDTAAPPSWKKAAQNPAAMASPDDATWIEIQKSIGPFYFEKAGVRFAKGDIWFLLNAALTAAGLTLSLDGLSVGSSLKKFDPKFDLRGLGIDYRQGTALEMGGTFLRFHNDKDNYDEYDGIADLKTEFLSLSVIGSYAKPDGHPSLFIYISLDYPLGGPPFFFVTGLAGGFGYNRTLNVPPVEQLLQFPLVSEAVSRAETEPVKDPGNTTSDERNGSPDNEDNNSPVASQNARRDKLSQEIESLRRYIPPEVGQYFLAVGIRATTFEMLDSFTLLTIAFGHRFELNIIGLTAFTVPPGPAEAEPEPPLIRVELITKASYLPDDGFLGIRSLLTSNSYLFDPSCHLTGGLAFYSWFKGDHDGEFVLTVGGYHRKFRVPDYYPKVPRLGFNWQLSSQLSIKGGAYFALTGHAFMAGGFLDALWDSGDLRAQLKIAADFLLIFKPYHYEAEFSIEIDATATIHFFGTHHLSLSLGADLQVWGPKFGGKAKIHIWVVSFSIAFGPDKQPLPPISWKEFRTSFLPDKRTDILGMSAQAGLLKTTKGIGFSPKGTLVKVSAPKGGGVKSLWTMNARYFSVVINSLIPANHQQLSTAKSGEKGAAVGIAPMALKPEQYQSTLQVTLLKLDENPGHRDRTAIDITVTPIFKPVPKGMWGDKQLPKVNSKTMVKGAMTGFHISPKAKGEGGTSHNIKRRNLAFDSERVSKAFNWEEDWYSDTLSREVLLTPHNVADMANTSTERTTLLSAFLSAQDLREMDGQLSAVDLLV